MIQLKCSWLLLLLVLFTACEENGAPQETEFDLLGSWTVTSMGVFTQTDCSGDLDYTLWNFVSGLGVSMTFDFSQDGTGTITTITPLGDDEIEAISWSLSADSLCIDDLCIAFDADEQGSTIYIQQQTEAFCADSEGNVTDHSSQTACIAALNTWFPESCYQFELTRDDTE